MWGGCHPPSLKHSLECIPYKPSILVPTPIDIHRLRRPFTTYNIIKEQKEINYLLIIIDLLQSYILSGGSPLISGLG